MGNLNVEPNDATLKNSFRSTVAKLLPKIRPGSKIPLTQLALT